MRDKLKDREYFNGYIDYQNQRIDKFEGLLEQLINEKGTEFKGVRTGKLSLVNFYLDKMNALYSLGAPVKEIKQLFPKVIQYFTDIWNKEGSYSNLLKIVSLAILFNISKDQLKGLLDLIKKEQLDDKLIDFLVQYIDLDWENNGSEYLFSNPYGYVQNIIEAENQNTALELLKVYLEKEWYKGHNETGWYESHKGNKDIYSGYWSYESGAVAKILRLDDTQLREGPYYPYDLVHFEE
ncbi:PoNi-like cognate immunity protein [Solibacillus isronensis]|uniref:PoNi-like cognate immunity protein n=1 Tax=Solibacillus isronensis TaxID=412383 RepID=UPI00203CBFD8|nr:PoNi-like cognate immunity protein [Solibacillus isronensis]MCM3720615.1 PoNi-like cognate immunity protein [Solibacillus isronensis]